MGLFVGVLSALLAGLLGLLLGSLERKPEWQTKGLWITGVLGLHAVWVLMRWSGEGDSGVRRRISRWIGVGIGLIGLGALGTIGYRLKNRVQPVTLSSYRARIAAVAIDANGRQVATVDAGGKLILWDVRSGKPRWSRLRGPAKGPNDIVFSPDKGPLLSQERDELIILDSETGRRMHSLPSERIFDFAPNQPLVALSGPELCLWNIQDGESKRCVCCADATAALFTTDDGLWATCSSREAAVIWDLPSGQAIDEIPLPNNASFWLYPEDDHILTHHRLESSTRLWAWHAGVEAFRIDVPWATSFVAGRLPDGQLVLVDQGDSAAGAGAAGIRLYFVDLATGDTQAAFGGAAVSSFALSRGGRYAVTTSLDPAEKGLHAVRVWYWSELVNAGAP